ncbi:MAG: hypothetical protein P4L22_00355 [Candidatus Babeliales bacterium]|nr:hypothetical protein [Candidatus Babeliales bacterium]
MRKFLLFWLFSLGLISNLPVFCMEREQIRREDNRRNANVIYFSLSALYLLSQIPTFECDNKVEIFMTIFFASMYVVSAEFDRDLPFRMPENERFRKFLGLATIVLSSSVLYKYFR